MQGGAPNGLGGGGNSGMSGPPMGGNNQGNQGNMSGNKTSTQVTIPKDVSRNRGKWRESGEKVAKLDGIRRKPVAN